MFICSNDPAAKQTATGILDQFGWETLDLSGVEAARAIRTALYPVVHPRLSPQRWTHASKVLHD